MPDRPTSSAVRPQPTFLLLGAPKSAARWLRLNLGLHPEAPAPRSNLHAGMQGDVPVAPDAKTLTVEAYDRIAGVKATKTVTIRVR